MCKHKQIRQPESCYSCFNCQRKVCGVIFTRFWRKTTITGCSPCLEWKKMNAPKKTLLSSSLHALAAGDLHCLLPRGSHGGSWEINNIGRKHVGENLADSQKVSMASEAVYWIGPDRFICLHVWRCICVENSDQGMAFYAAQWERPQKPKNEFL